MRVVIAGGNGFIGRGLTRELLDHGHQVTWLSHRPGRVQPPQGVDEIAFRYTDPTGPWAAAIAEAEAVVNLSGHPIASRWNARVKRAIVESRIGTTTALATAIRHARAAGSGPRVLVNASGIGVYGDGGDGWLTEQSPTGGDWLADLARSWEEAALRVAADGCRCVVVRTGVVLGAEGFVPRMALPFRLFVGGPIGSGRQWVPWIHHTDISGIYAFALTNASVSGPVNAVAPGIVRMREFAAVFGRVLNRPSWLPVPALALRIALGEVAPYLLKSQRASCEKLIAAGYVYRFPELYEALFDVLGTGRHG